MYGDEEKIRCPCVYCANSFSHTLPTVEAHLIDRGFQQTYQVWNFHGETFPSSLDSDIESQASYDYGDTHDDMFSALHDMAAQIEVDDDSVDVNENSSLKQEECDKYAEMFNNVRNELYPGCKSFSALTFLVKLMHIKVLNKWSSKSFDMLLKLLGQSFPEGTILPKSFYDAKMQLRSLGLGYESIHVCRNDCALFWKDNAQLSDCPVCKESRWIDKDAKGKKVAHKTLRYIPIPPRLKRLFSSRHTAKDMRWHEDERPKNEGVLRHPTDGEAWKNFDRTFPSFTSDPRNVRMGLASDGFNPFRMRNGYSMWLVILVPYNMPTWKCLKQSSFIMALLIPGPKAPGKDIDVFLRLLIDELKELWDRGAETIDTTDGKSFCMRAAVMWTINNFPTLGIYLGG